MNAAKYVSFILAATAAFVGCGSSNAPGRDAASHPAVNTSALVAPPRGDRSCAGRVAAEGGSVRRIVAEGPPLRPERPDRGEFLVIDQSFIRDKGEPKSDTVSFTVPDPSARYLLRLTNPLPGRPRATAGTLILNGREVVDLNGKCEHETAVKLGASNRLTVVLHGKPGSGLGVQIVGVDRIPPALTARIEPAPNQAGWNSGGGLQIIFQCSDATAGVRWCPQPVSVAAEGLAVVTAVAYDEANNPRTLEVPVCLDVTAPTVRIVTAPEAPNAAGWFNRPVTVSAVASDELSGVAHVTAPLTLAEDGEHSVTQDARDVADNEAQATALVKIDQTRPDVTIDEPAEGAQLTAARAPVRGTVSDARSGVAQATCNGVPTPVTAGRFECEVVLRPGANRIEVRARDRAGNNQTAVRPVVTSFVPEPAPDVAEKLANFPGATMTSVSPEGAARFVSGALGDVRVAGSSPPAPDDLQLALEGVAPLFRVSASNLVLESIRTSPDNVHHARYAQRKNGLAVEGGHIILHVSSGGRVFAANGSAYDGVSIPAEPHLAASDAAEATRSLFGTGVELQSSPSLGYIIRAGDRRMALTFAMTAKPFGPSGLPERIFINAYDGGLFDRQTSLSAAAPIRVYDLQAADFVLPGTLVRSNEQPGISTDAVVETHFQHLLDIEDFFRTHLGLDSWDNRGSPVVSTVHLHELRTGWRTDLKQMTFADSYGPQKVGQTATDVDIVTHEYWHAVSDASSHLRMEDQPGGVAEGMADVAAAASWSIRNGLITSSATWQIGEQAFTPAVAGDAMRYLDDPARGDSTTLPNGHVFDHYADYLAWRAANPGCDGDDHCRAHDLAGVVGLGFYLLSQGGQHPRRSGAQPVPGIGIADAFAVFAQTELHCLFSNADLEDLRQCTADMARVRLGSNGAAAVHLAWDAVGVPGSPNRIPVKVTKQGGSGVVTETRFGRIDCGSKCEAIHGRDDELTFVATPSPGFRFVGWQGGCSGNGPCQIRMVEWQTIGVSLLAVFEVGPDTVVTVRKSGDGFGKVSGGGIDCGGTCSSTATPGQPLTLIAEASPGSSFDGWTGPCSGAGACDLTPLASVEVSATFNRLPGCFPPACQTFTATVTGTMDETCRRTSESVMGTIENFDANKWKSVFYNSFVARHRLDLEARGRAGDRASIGVEKVIRKTTCQGGGQCTDSAERQSLGGASCTISASGGFECTGRTELTLQCQSFIPCLFCPQGANCRCDCTGFEWFLTPGSVTGRATLTSVETIDTLGIVEGRPPYQVTSNFLTEQGDLDIGGFFLPFTPSAGCTLKSGTQQFKVSSGNPKVSVNFSDTRATQSRSAGAHLLATLGPCQAVDGVDPPRIDAPGAGASGTATVSSGDICRWSAVSNASWISIKGDGSGVGGTTFDYEVQPNPSCRTARDGAIAVSDKTIVVAQAPSTTLCNAELLASRGGAIDFGGGISSKSESITVTVPVPAGMRLGGPVGTFDLDRDRGYDDNVVKVRVNGHNNVTQFRMTRTATEVSVFGEIHRKAGGGGAWLYFDVQLWWSGPARCGNSWCEPEGGDSRLSCPGDCLPYCGDGVCEPETGECGCGECLTDESPHKQLCTYRNMHLTDDGHFCTDGWGDCNGTLSDGCETQEGYNSGYCEWCTPRGRRACDNFYEYGPYCWDLGTPCP